MQPKDIFNSPEWKELQEMQSTWEQEFETSSEAIWNSLSKEDQLKIFCAVVRRIYKAELEDKGTYRHALYNVFGFGPESYAAAQMSGYLALHNAVVDDEYTLVSNKLNAFAKEHGLDEQLVKDFMVKNI